MCLSMSQAGANPQMNNTPINPTPIGGHAREDDCKAGREDFFLSQSVPLLPLCLFGMLALPLLPSVTLHYLNQVFILLGFFFLYSIIGLLLFPSLF